MLEYLELDRRATRQLGKGSFEQLEARFLPKEFATDRLSRVAVSNLLSLSVNQRGHEALAGKALMRQSRSSFLEVG